ncbi:MAG: CDGSH iron-sulfur domain-containing protein [Gammaproteobacteria bacterium]
MTDPIQENIGKKIIVRFEAAKCIHSRNCVLGNPEVFIPNASGYWIQPDASSAEEIAALVRTCPSGALTFERLDGGEEERAPLVNTVRLRENGPLAFHADMAIQGHGTCYRAALCRCGASRNKPFCDGSHHAANFTATGEPGGVDSEPLSERSGKLTVNPIANGPLQIEGNLEVCSGTGRTLNRTRKTWLCRCGGSQNKPYCDGTHRKIGFTS